MKVSAGYYKHFKGNYYLVEGTALHTETLEELVVYRAQYGERNLFVRPLTMFLEEVQHQGNAVPRFKLLEGNELANYLVNELMQDLTDSLLGTNDK